MNVGTFSVLPEISEIVLISFFFVLFCGDDFHHSSRSLVLPQFFCH